MICDKWPTLSRFFTCLDKDSDESCVVLDKVSGTNLAQIIKPNYHEEIPKTPLSAHHTTSDIWGSDSKKMIKIVSK